MTVSREEGRIVELFSDPCGVPEALSLLVDALTYVCVCVCVDVCRER